MSSDDDLIRRSEIKRVCREDVKNGDSVMSVAGLCSRDPVAAAAIELAEEHLDGDCSSASIADYRAAKEAVRRPLGHCPTPNCLGPGPDVADKGPDDEEAVTVPCTHCGRTKP